MNDLRPISNETLNVGGVQVNMIVVGQRRIFEARRDVYRFEIAITRENRASEGGNVGVATHKTALSSDTLQGDGEQSVGMLLSAMREKKLAVRLSTAALNL